MRLPITLLSVGFLVWSLLPVSMSEAQVTVYNDELEWQGLVDSPTLADFDDLAANEPLAGQYPGAVFSDFGDGSPRAGLCFARSDPHSMITVGFCNGGGGGFAVDFDPPMSALGLWSGDLELAGSSIEFFDLQGDSIEFMDLLDAFSTCPCPLAWGFAGFVASVPVSRVEVFIANDDLILFDDMQYVTVESGPFIRGDANADGNFNGVADGVTLLAYAFVPGSPVPPCLDALDCDDDGVFNGVVDAVYLLGFAFVPGSAPMPGPYPDCGVDPTPETTIGCLGFPTCP